MCLESIKFLIIAVHHSGYLEALVHDVGVGRVVVIWNAFGLKIPDFAQDCIAWVLQGEGGTSMLSAAASILFPVSTVEEAYNDSQVALISIKDEQVVSIMGGLGGGDCILGMEAEFEGIWCGMFSKESSKLGLEMGWGLDGGRSWGVFIGKIVSWKITRRETICLVNRL